MPAQLFGRAGVTPGDLGTFGIFALLVLYMVFKYVLPQIRGTKEGQSLDVKGPASKEIAQLSEAVAQMKEMVKELHAWHDKPLPGGGFEWYARSAIGDLEQRMMAKIVDVENTLEKKHDSLAKSATKIREQLIEYRAESSARRKIGP